LGDVAMTLPILHQVSQQYPQTKITVVSNEAYSGLFNLLPRCAFYPAELKGRHAGAAGIWKLFRAVRTCGPFDAVVDLHGVLRTHMLSALFRAGGTTVRQIDKGRKEKKALTRQHNKSLHQLTPMHTRYAEVFAAARLPLHLDSKKIPLASKRPCEWLNRNVPENNLPLIGVAPFARHSEKMLPLHKTRKLVEMLNQQGHTVLLFGGGREESGILQQWQEEIKGAVINSAGKCGLQEELDIISNLSAMVSMDSANMHLASLFGIPVVSIWGATHPFAGFYGWAQPEKNAIGVELPCRPCSVFGNKPCFRGDHLCMEQISIDAIMQALDQSLQLK
jgi:ADP-heptose:LPS heptosyltransferase